MTLERKVLISTLKMTRDARTQIKNISLDASVPFTITRRILRRYSKMGFVRLNGEAIIIEEEQRLRLAVRTVELGADLERVCKLLGWKEFEDISALAFENSGFSVLKRFRFKHLDKRWEVDVLALKNPSVVCVDCKHWRRGWQRSAISRTAESQTNRTQNLAEASPRLRDRIGISRWRSATFIPTILSLIPGPFKFYEGVPIVPILQIRDFINEMPVHITMLTHFSKKY